jgi:hypothetical protein
MAIPTVTELEEGKQDLDDMESAVNGGVGVTVTTRLGTSYPSFAKAVADLQADVGAANVSEITATAAQVAFTVTAYDVSSSDSLLFINGAYISPSDYTRTDTTTVTLDTGAFIGDKLVWWAKEPKTSASLAPVNLATGSTPSVSGVKSALTNNGGAVSITNFTNAYAGQTLKIIGNDSGNTTITDTATIKLEGGASFVLGNNDMIVLFAKTAILWIEETRSNN